jgi:hypothetical protein
VASVVVAVADSPQTAEAPPPSICGHPTFPTVFETCIVFRVSWPPPLLLLFSEPLLP